jgi:hypothetical protein
MNREDDYISGPHHYWVHFACGFIFGVVAGWEICRWLFSDNLLGIIGAVVSGFCLGLSCGKWGDRVWKAIFESFWWRP